MNSRDSRDLLVKVLKEKVIGPGYYKGLYQCACNLSDEILPSHPCSIYYSGIMYPSKAVYQNPFEAEMYPSFIGLNFCVSPNTNCLYVDVKYAKYDRIQAVNGVRVIVPDHLRSTMVDAIAFLDSDVNLTNGLGGRSFSDVVSYDAACHSLERISMDNMPKLPDVPAESSHLIPACLFLNNTIRDTSFYRRNEFNNNFTINPQQSQGVIPINQDLNCCYDSYVDNGKLYVHFLVLNAHQVGGNTSLKTDALFQTEVKISGTQFEDATEMTISAIDQENNINEYIYRNAINLGKGVNCAATWDNTRSWIATTYSPEVIVKDFTNSIDNLGQIFNVRDYSIWGKTDVEIIAQLSSLVSAYDNWCTSQLNMSLCDEARILQDRQNELLGRLRENVTYLQNSAEAMTCFKIANTAMLMQMVSARDPYFEQNSTLNTATTGDFTSLDYFIRDSYLNSMGIEPAYRPFQLAFLLMNVKSTFEAGDAYRNDIVDLIWFPTGGGKTEAYLALTALTIAHRRRRTADERISKGVSVVMRYTLRMLASQQYERASMLICAMELLRREEPNLNLGANEPITIGLWIGAASTPNRIADLRNGEYNRFFNSVTGRRPALPERNPFPVGYCPWCKSPLIYRNPAGAIIYGYNNNGTIHCRNTYCAYSAGIPLKYIDEAVYSNPPTLLFGTVDKFANLTQANGARLFGLGQSWDTPDLIIQDELHLISGPLGSMVGLFESIIEMMASAKGRRPKIIASTATTRNTQSLINNLYNRQVRVFPAQGIEYSDNFFSSILGYGKRMHVGLMPTGKNSTMTGIRITAALLYAKIVLLEDDLIQRGVNLNQPSDVFNALTNAGILTPEYDDFWSLLLYFNSLKDLGRMKSRIPAEIREELRHMVTMSSVHPVLNFVCEQIENRVCEFTSREDSTKIKPLMIKAASPANLELVANRIFVRGDMDIIEASNMVSVGIDIPRWNEMIMFGQPKSTSEYIQSSSRVARRTDGLVINVLGVSRSREKSMYENYTSFHSLYYKYVEPLCATPLTEMTINKMLHSLMVCYFRHIKLTSIDLVVRDRHLFDVYLNDFRQELRNRYTVTSSAVTLRKLDDSIDSIVASWSALLTIHPNSRWEDVVGDLPTSLRTVDPNTYIKIAELN